MALKVDDRYLRPSKLFKHTKDGFLHGAKLDSTFVYEHLWKFDLDLDNPSAEEQCSALFRITEDLEFPGRIDTTLHRKYLTEVERDEVLRSFNAPDTCDISGAACFDPHHTIVFHDNESRVVGYIQICFSCHTFRFSAGRSKDDDLELCDRDWDILARLLTKPGVD